MRKCNSKQDKGAIHTLIGMAIICLALVFYGNLIPFSIKTLIYTVSFNIKQIVSFFLPFVIFLMLFINIFRIGSSATRILFITVILLCISNYIATIFSYFTSSFIQTNEIFVDTEKHKSILLSIWNLPISPPISNSTSITLGVIFGLVASIFFKKMDLTLLEKVLKYIFCFFRYAIPAFVIGSFLKLEHDGIMKLFSNNILQLVFVIFIAQVLYVAIMYFIPTILHPFRAIKRIVNILPPAFAGAISMSSAMVMPITIDRSKKNLDNKSIAEMVLPISTNNHLIGDCIAIPIIIFATLKIFGYHLPDLYTYFEFALYFVIAKFSVVAIPGGGIIVMLPIIQAYFITNESIISLITGIYILLDPIITFINVLGNGAFVCIVEYVTKKGGMQLFNKNTKF